MRVTTIIICLLACRAANAAAQRADSTGVAGGSVSKVEQVRRAIDSVLDLRDSRRKVRVDTAYLRRAPERLRLKLRLNCSGSDITTKGTQGGSPFESALETDLRTTLSIGASYRGLSVGVALNPAKLTGKDNDYELNLTAYGNRLGGEVVFLSSKAYKGTVSAGAVETEVAAGAVSQQMLTLNAYYAFSGRRFSFPAAFTQSWLQRRSHGSFMLGLTFMGGRLRYDYGNESLPGETTLGIICAGVGAGYGYNWVTKRGWLLHLSTLPELVVFSRCRLTAAGGREKMPYRFPNIMAVGRMAVVRHSDKYFAGFTAVVNTSYIGDSDRLSVGTTKWRARMFVGIKL